MTLSSFDGDLVSVRWPVDARLLENALEVLACAPFPINPHLIPAEAAGPRKAIIEFPAYSGQLERLGRVLAAHGMDSRELIVSDMFGGAGLAKA